MIIRAVYPWPSNGELMADVARLYFARTPGVRILDCTYGSGGFWSKIVVDPARFVAHDLRTDGVDFRKLPHGDGEFDVVVMDPPYRLRGTPRLGEKDRRFGTEEYMPWPDIHALIRDGIDECARVTKVGGLFLLKCQDQVCSGRVRWQTIEFTVHAMTVGLDLIDRFDLLGTAVPQPMGASPRYPDGRSQKHAHGRPSTLLVFEKEKP